ncbi:ATP-binding protein [Roseivirga sp.]|uniref:sensor histidine kinase n=1 Tax=Roseivirga sp. TaxID=1964215 RepID=UPI003B5231E4
MNQLRKLLIQHKAFLISVLLVGLTLVIDEAIFSDQKRRVNPEETISQNLSVQLQQLDEQLRQISDIAVVDLSRLFNRFSNNDEMPYFIFENGEVIYWSTNRFVPKYGTLDGTYIYRFLELKSGQYIVKRKVINSAQNRVVEIYAMLPLSSDVPLNDSFRDYGLNGKVFGRSSFTLSSAENASGERNVYSPEGIFLFSFEGTERMKIDYPNYAVLILLLYLVAIYFFIRSGYHYAIQLADGKLLLPSIILLTIFLGAVRLLMLRYEYPLSVVEWGLFQPDYFAESWWQPSLGDFLLNQLAILSIVVFAFVRLTRLQKPRDKARPAFILIAVILLLGAIYYFIQEARSLFSNSQWSFDVGSDISFSGYKFMAYFALFVIGVIPFLIGQYLSTELRKIRKSGVVIFVLASVIIASATLVYLLGGPYAAILLVLAVYLLVVYYFRLAEQLYQANYSTFLYLFATALLVATISNILLGGHIKNEALGDKRSLATRLLSENDLEAEYLLSQARERIESDVLIQTNIANPFSSKDLIRQKIQRVFLGEYFDKYEIEVLIFNGNGIAVNSSTPFTYDELRAEYGQDINQTEFENLYFYRSNYPVVLNQYYLFNEIRRYGVVIGYVLVRLDRKEVLNNSILPQLLLNESPETSEFGHLDYAVFEGRGLQSSSGDFNYRRDFDVNLLDQDAIYESPVSIAGYDHLAVRNQSNNQVFVISSHHYPLQYLITNFSVFFLFTVGMIILIFGVSAGYFNTRKQSVTLSAKIQILLNFAFFLPLIIVSIVVLRLVNTTVEQNIENQYLATTESAANNLANQLQLFLEGRNENNEALENRISEISQYARADINLFNTNGRLIATNQRLIFDNELLAPFINPQAMANIIESGGKEELFTERVGNLALSYKSTYFGIRSNENNQLLGVLSMPFFDSEEQLKAEQRDILSNILNSFTFIFVIFVVLSFLASRILTYPFKFLTEKIKRTTLSNLNEPLTWPAEDEIGLMVGEYNKMLANLEKSKRALALSEKESAWREMAQQVAHEIKNPLTPMKLKLQHLKRVLSSAPDLDTDFNKPIDNLLSQVETLSDIATSFSSFAKMPMPRSERINLAEVLKKSVRLFHEDKIEIHSNIPRQPVWVMADDQLLGRIFNNLILNAAQAMPEGKVCQLEVELVVTHNKARITFADDGMGIPEEIREKIFIPKFSTKAEGSGIGLAIAKRGVEHAGGSIWFESATGEGTTFYLEFPLTD